MAAARAGLRDRLPHPLPALPAPLRRLVLGLGLIDTNIAFGDYARRQAGWERGLAGRQWALETSGSRPGRAFCPELATVPAVSSADVEAGRRRAAEAFAARVTAAGGPFPAPVTVEILKAAGSLRRCTSGPPGLFSRAPAGGLSMSEPKAFPARQGDPVVRGLQVLTAVRPLFEGVFTAAAELGWNDLLYATAGAGCFRGTKLPPHAAFADPTVAGTRLDGVQAAVRAAQRMSNHAVGVAVDLNDFENTQRADRALGSMDPRVVALFQAFGFRWGACLPTPDPMHFEVDERALARPAPSPTSPPEGSPR